MDVVQQQNVEVTYGERGTSRAKSTDSCPESESTSTGATITGALNTKKDSDHGITGTETNQSGTQFSRCSPFALVAHCSGSRSPSPTAFPPLAKFHWQG